MSVAAVTTASALPQRASSHRVRIWLAAAALVIIGAFVVALTRPAPGVPLDPASPSKSGSKALAQLLDHRGTEVNRVTALSDVPTGQTVVVSSPDDFSAEQLQSLISRGDRLVLIAPSNEILRNVDPRLFETDVDSEASTVAPDCAAVGAVAAGPVRFPAGTQVYGGVPGCYGGRALLDEIVVLGSQHLIRNDGLTEPGVAALAINAISTDSAGTSVHAVAWLMPGEDAAGSGEPTVWSIFPPWTERVFGWSIVVGVLLVLWRGRRMGPAVTEPLPVVVRAAEIVEGHGRLYLRAGARDRAAAALRLATVERLTARLGLGPRATPAELADRLDRDRGVPTAETLRLLTGPTPVDDAALVALAGELDRLEAATPTARSDADDSFK
ncbi:DUF4350 domain-containing protein [Jatrophihabitans sp. DSM 45814]